MNIAYFVPRNVDSEQVSHFPSTSVIGCLSVCVYIGMYMYISIIYVWKYVCIYTGVYVSKYVCMYILCVYVGMYDGMVLLSISFFA